ncbi:undecaprenyl-diphosphate phosphatase [candidate division KSB1 bacterium]|nr:undecaprenyl-diphosphate phosphatase [candidate division KSB1 bacterium]
MTLLEAVILGLIQGFTEFLPISSSGHLVLGKELLHISALATEEIGITFEVFVHFGTLLAVVTVFWSDVLKLINAFFSLFTIPFKETTIEEKYHQDSFFRMMVLILLGSLPAGIIGIFLEDTIEDAFGSPKLVCAMLLVTGAILLSSRYFLNGKQKLNSSNALVIGLAQAFAIIPGISRSGSTISTGLIMGLEREESARFSFLLALPVIAGATVLKLKELIGSPPESAMILNLIVGTIVAYLSGFVAIKILLAVVRHGRLDRFSYYCFVIGIIGLLFI